MEPTTRGICRAQDRGWVSDEDVVGLNIPTGIPLRYDLDANLAPLVAGGTYLDPAAAAAGAAAVAGQGAK